MEISIRDGEDRIIIETPRNVVMLNTPGINNFEFDTVLTTPRACRFTDATISLSAIEKFMQAKYTISESFILTPHFRSMVKDDLPSIRYRIGLQAVKEEDRRILDYSELITSLETGAGRKFIDMISRYINGSNTTFPGIPIDKLLSVITFCLYLGANIKYPCVFIRLKGFLKQLKLSQATYRRELTEYSHFL